MDDPTHLITGERPVDTVTQELNAISQETPASNPSQGAPGGSGP